MREMRDSGVEWIGEIPKDWNCCKQKYRFTLINGRAFKDNEFEEDGTYRILRVGNLFSNPVWYSSSLELEPDKYCEKGDLIYAWSMSYGPYIWNEEKVIYHYHIWKTKLVSDMDKMFSYYYLQALTESIKSQTHETTMGFVTMGIMNNSYIAYPRNIKEQKKISDYLDAKCSKIDEIIEKQLSIIEKLKEYKLSIITEAVTSGINPDVEMKDSGSVWFGNIPINWEMKRLKYVFHIQKDIAGEEGHTVLSITQRGIIPKDFSNNEGQFANSYANYQLVHKGDFAMNHMDLLTGWVDISKYEGVTSPDYRVFVLNDKNGMCPKYYLYMMQMCYSARIFYGLRYNVMLSEDENTYANDEWSRLLPDIRHNATVDLDAVFGELQLINPRAKSFLSGIQTAFMASDIDMADELIRKRERSLKGAARAKLSRTKEFDHSKWVGGGMLDYRFSNARRIVNDIYAGEVNADV